MTSQYPLQEFDLLLKSSEFLFVVYYRGHWCPFCKAYLSTLHTLEATITAARGTTLIITSEPESFLEITRNETGYQGKAIVDTKNTILKELKARGAVDIAVSEKKGYEHGMAQPAVVVMKNDGTVLENWAIVPSLMNLGGAKDRPDLLQIWENVQAKMMDKKTVHTTYKTQGALGVLLGKVFG